MSLSIGQVPKETVQAVTKRPITYALGFLGGSFAHGLLQNALPSSITSMNYQIPGTTVSVGVSDAIKVALDFVVAQYGERIPVVGNILRMLGGSKPFAYGMIGQVAYSKIHMQFPSLPSFGGYASFPAFQHASDGFAGEELFPHAMASFGAMEEPDIHVI